MADFDSLWDDNMDVDVDNLDATVDISDRVSNAVKVKNKSQLDTNAEYIDGEDWDSLSREEQADRFISTVEKTNAARYSKWAERLNSKKDYLIDKLHNAKETNAPTGKLVAQLQHLRDEYRAMLSKKSDDEYQTDITKARVIGLITPEEGDELLIDRKALKQALDNGNYKYKSTNF